MVSAIVPFLTFNGQAAEAMDFYVSVLPEASITRREPYGDQVPHIPVADRGRIMQGEISVRGSLVRFLDFDSTAEAPPFAWSSSLFLECLDEAEFDSVFAALSAGGTVMMGPEAVGPIRKVGWIVDRFGVTWQPVWR
ncbi:MAG: VOC family protein [Promicromonosporaceae bacterium]|nr:VOC family protein [Promicromonosporaceae bacterium]